MDVDFVYLDTLEALRPKLVIHRTFADAGKAVDDRFESLANEADGE
jgi:regulator of nonsense transcripts 2